MSYFAKLFGFDNLDSLEIEFARYKCGKFPPEISECVRVDEGCHRISASKNVNGTPKFSLLSTLMLSILTAHSNASTERVFSIVKKSAFQSSMSTRMEDKSFLTMNF